MYEDVEVDDGPVSKFQAAMGRKWQHYLDLSAPHTAPRWCLSFVVMLIYCLRVYLINGVRCTIARARHARVLPPHRSRVLRAGWYIITYGLGIYILNQLIGFLTPASDPDVDGPMLPTSKDDEFRPVRRPPFSPRAPRRASGRRRLPRALARAYAPPLSPRRAHARPAAALRPRSSSVGYPSSSFGTRAPRPSASPS